MKKQRPISPHLQVYKPQLTSILSITHRLTGVALSAALVVLCYGVLALNLGGESYNSFLNHVGAWYGKTLMIGWGFSFYYHLCNGLRHFYWDIGKGYSLKTVYRTGWMVVAIAIGLTLITAMKVV
tara:strand:+ start:70248 stop:70622 length:375 start_codon:yes stop_codon:yes gene_type:complete